MNGEINNALKEELLTAYMIAGFRRFLVYGFENDPSDAELEEMFPDERKHIRLGKKYVRLEKAVEKRRSEPNSFTLYLKRAAVIVMTVVSLTTAVMMTDTNVRAAVEHAVVECVAPDGELALVVVAEVLQSRHHELAPDLL